MIAQYDMSFRLSTYDVVNWLAHVKVLGATEVVFNLDNARSTKWPMSEMMARFENYIRPMPALFGLLSRLGRDGNAEIGSDRVQDLFADMRRLGVDVPRMRSIKPPYHKKYTVTIRETFHNRQKNSDRDLWLRFAREVGALVIEDTMREPISLYDRIAYYAGSQMNFGIPNGPMALLYYTPWSFRIMVDAAVNTKSFAGHKIKNGGQIPWLLPNQRIVWEKATMANLMREVEALEEVA